MRVQVLFFAAVRELAGVGMEHLEVEANTNTEQLRQILTERYPQVAELLPRCALACNGEYSNGIRELAENDEVAILPPVSGG
mmetsp:Transcript_74926/g.124922  ORF Transcript_74926/g.124922 Transcript_74926/m.124922 type:complete len:82 (-) Transcript_74926:146-391(-)